MNIEEYHAHHGISSSNLKLLAESPLHLYNKDLFKTDSEVFKEGRMIHSFILENESFDDEYIVTEKLDLRTKAGKEKKELYEKSGKILVDDDKYYSLVLMRQNVHAIAGQLLNGGVAEKSFIVDSGNLTLKCRPDYLIQDLGIVTDLKSIADISEYGIRKAITTYKYHWQAYFYMKVLEIAGIKIDHFIFVFVEKTAPFNVKIREIGLESMAVAHVEVEQLLSDYSNFLETKECDIIKNVEIFGVE